MKVKGNKFLYISLIIAIAIVITLVIAGPEDPCNPAIDPNNNADGGNPNNPNTVTLQSPEYGNTPKESSRKALQKAKSADKKRELKQKAEALCAARECFENPCELDDRHYKKSSSGRITGNFIFNAKDGHTYTTASHGMEGQRWKTTITTSLSFKCKKCGN